MNGVPDDGTPFSFLLSSFKQHARFPVHAQGADYNQHFVRCPMPIG
jgi:hypothetical protein